MPVRRLPSKPSLDHLKHQAKDLLRGHAARDPFVAQQMREFHPKFAGARDADILNAKLKLSDAQLTIARESGFPSWARLKSHIVTTPPSGRPEKPHHERIDDAGFRRAVELLDNGDVKGLRDLLQREPGLTRQRVMFEGGNYFRNPTLLEFIAENPARHGTMPRNIVEVARVILQSGVEREALNETLMLVSTGSVARERGMQGPLIDLLCKFGANADAAAQAAALHGEPKALEALLAHGARVTLVVAAALGRSDVFQHLLPAAGREERHLALAVATQYGRIDLLRLLLDAGEDPNRYNPVGGHSHATPLHQAAAAGNLDMVKLLLERGADVSTKDVLWHASPADWAKHEGKPEVAAYLRALEPPGPQKETNGA